MASPWATARVVEHDYDCADCGAKAGRNCRSGCPAAQGCNCREADCGACMREVYVNGASWH